MGGLLGNAEGGRDGGVSRLALITLAVHALAEQLAVAADGFGLFTGLALGWLLIVAAELHLAKNAFTLHLLLQRTQRLIDVIVANEDLHERTTPSDFGKRQRADHPAAAPSPYHSSNEL